MANHSVKTSCPSLDDGVDDAYEADIYVGTIEPVGSDEVESTSSPDNGVKATQYSAFVGPISIETDAAMPKISNITGNFSDSRAEALRNSQNLAISVAEDSSSKEPLSSVHTNSSPHNGKISNSAARYPITDDIMTQCLHEAKKRKAEEESEDADISFLKSLVPDMKKMNDRQKNRFKRNVLSVIDDILYGK